MTLPTDFLETISLYANEYELQRITMKKYRELAAQRLRRQAAVLRPRTRGSEAVPTAQRRKLVSLYYYGDFRRSVGGQR